VFEWWLLMLFYEHDFAGLPWSMSDDSYAIGEEVRAEIAESFEWIDQFARVTITGRFVLARMQELVAEADSHWQTLFGGRNGR
jgi:hypothetical protein